LLVATVRLVEPLAFDVAVQYKRCDSLSQLLVLRASVSRLRSFQAALDLLFCYVLVSPLLLLDKLDTVLKASEDNVYQVVAANQD